MKVQDAAIAFSAEHASTRRSERSETLRIERNPPAVNTGNTTTLNSPVDTIEISDKARNAIANAREGQSSSGDARLDANMRVMKEILKRLMGREFDLALFEFDKVTNRMAEEGAAEFKAVPSLEAGTRISYEYHESYYEAEVVSFAAEGVIRTADGESVDFSINLTMSREFLAERSLSLTSGTQVDPLVLNFHGTAAELSNAKFSFDLDADGSDESISNVNPGSAFLALDKNSDGVINNGNELFGPDSGDGFAELAAYDEDGNEFIDEADSVFDRLRLFNPNPSGQGQLKSLSERGVAAIYLGRIATPFSIKDDQNVTNGTVASTGVFVMDSKAIGTVQQVDLVV